MLKKWIWSVKVAEMSQTIRS